MRVTQLERFWNKVNKTPSCWEWTSPLSNGYGSILWNGKPQRAHRVIFEIIGKQIPDGLVVDHVCRNRKCINPKHLRFVTPRTNVLENSNSVSAMNARKTKCLRGHVYDAENTKILSNTDSKDSMQRVCKKCTVLRDKNITGMRTIHLRLTLRVDKKLREKIFKTAKKRGVGVAEFIRECVKKEV